MSAIEKAQICVRNLIDDYVALSVFRIAVVLNSPHFGELRLHVTNPEVTIV